MRITFLGIVVLLFVLGLSALVRGLRGRRVDDHPLCRRCGFDLTGKPDGSTRCSECGTDLSQPHAVRIGHRQRRPAMIAVGAMMLSLILLGVGWLGWFFMGNVSVDQLMPTWWVIREAGDRSPGAPVSAWTELNRRLKAGSLSQPHVDRISKLALAIQGDKTSTWNAVYGDFIEVARKAKLLSDADWQTYARQAPNMTLELRAKVRRGDSIPASLVEAGHRIGSNSRLTLRISRQHAVGALINDPPITGSPGYNTSQLGVSGASRSGHNMPIDKRAVTTAPAGPRTAALEFDVEVREGFDDKDAVVARWKERLDGTWELVEANTETVELINDPSLEENVRNAFTVRRLYYYGPRSLSLDLEIRDLKVPVAFDVFLRADGKEHGLSSISVNTGNTSYGTGGQVKIAAAKADVIFRPSTQAARNTVQMNRIWNGGFEVRGVTISPPATQPGASP